MDEYLFIELAKLQADRRRLEREQREQAQPPGVGRSPRRTQGHREPLRRQWFASSVEQAVMKTFIAVVASLLVNGGRARWARLQCPRSCRPRRSAKC